MAPPSASENGYAAARAGTAPREGLGPCSQARAPNTVPVPAVSTARMQNETSPGATAAAIARFLRSFHALVVAARLYKEGHALEVATLESAQFHLHEALALVIPVAISVDENSLYFYGGPGDTRTLLTGNSLWPAIAGHWRRAGLRSVIFQPQTTQEELESFARLLGASGRRSEKSTRAASTDHWPALLQTHQIRDIRVNLREQIQPMQPALATLVSALVAHGATPSTSGKPTPPPSVEDVAAGFHLLAQLEPVLSEIVQKSPQASQSLYRALAGAQPRTLSQILRQIWRWPAQERESARQYLARIAEALLLENWAVQFSTGRLPLREVRNLCASLGEALQHATPASAQAGVSAAGMASILAYAGTLLAANVPSATNASEAAPGYAEQLHERFWDQLPAREKATVLRSIDAWCVPAAAVRRYVEQLLGPDTGNLPEAALRESRIVVASYARGLAAEEPRPRRTVASALLDMMPLLETLWPTPGPAEIDRAAVRGLMGEVSPGIRATLASLVEALGRSALRRCEFSRFEQILDSVRAAEAGAGEPQMEINALLSRLESSEIWLLLAQSALESPELDPALPRILQRDPERLLEYFGATFAAPEAASGQGINALAAMVRLVSACGESVMGALENHLFEARSQRVAIAVKLLAAADPQRLIASLPRALPGWDWNLQDLAISELSRRSRPDAAPLAARTFVEILPEAHEMVAPMMIDEIGLTGESAAVPLLLKIASGTIETLRDIFIRIKAVEALGRLRASEAAGLLRTLVRRHHGLMHIEPAGLRAAAEEALALMEHRPSSARVRAAEQARAAETHSHCCPRRYLRVPLSRAFAARVRMVRASQALAAAASGAAQAAIRTISLGGAFLESAGHFAPGDQLQLEIRVGLRRIRSLAVVRCVTPSGGGVEFLHMAQQDRERLRRMVRRLQVDAASA
jgi:PilZ domain